MRVWTRRARLGGLLPRESKETWELHDGERLLDSFPVEVTTGKALDVKALKGTNVEELRRYSELLESTARRLYGDPAVLVPVARCPCCEHDTTAAPEAITIFGIAYKKCSQCSHLFVGAQPKGQALEALFADSQEHSSIYTDRSRVEVRLEQVVRPKLDWLFRVYRKCHGRDPRSVLDVGAGAGHFLEVARRAGMRVQGLELSRSSQRFAREMFGIDLDGRDFLSLDGSTSEGAPDVVTFWGLLEYVQEPGRFVRQARRLLPPEGAMLVIEVPRADSLSTAVQTLPLSTVARHLDPTTHVNCFSDASLASLVRTAGFRPVAAWFFGMDAYELLVQLALRAGEGMLLEQLPEVMPALQSVFDQARLCDDVIVACVPEEGG